MKNMIFCSVHLFFRCLLYGWVHSHTWISTCQFGRAPSCECGVSLMPRAGSLRADWAHCRGDGTVGEEPWPQSSAWCEDSGFLGSAVSSWLVVPGTKRACGSCVPLQVRGFRKEFSHTRGWPGQRNLWAPQGCFFVQSGPCSWPWGWGLWRPWDMLGMGPHCTHECVRGMPHLERKECVWCFIIISITYFPDTALFFLMDF